MKIDSMEKALDAIERNKRHVHILTDEVLQKERLLINAVLVELAQTRQLAQARLASISEQLRDLEKGSDALIEYLHDLNDESVQRAKDRDAGVQRK